MARIKALKPWRFNERVAGNIENLTSPLFDVVSERQREKLYQNPVNSIHLSVPLGENPFVNARKTFATWQSREIIQQDKIEGIYPYFQEFTLPGGHEGKIRKGFVCLVKIGDEEADTVLLHENTIPKAVNDRVELLKETKLNVSPTHGLYHDPNHRLEPFLDEVMSSPLFETEDYQGVLDKISVIQDKQLIEKFQRVLEGQKIILADGHHRFASSKQFQAHCKAQNPNHTGEELYNYHLMYLTNSASKDLRILPTHRLISSLENFNAEKIIASLSEDFHVREIEDPYDVPDIILGKKHAFGVIFKNRYFKVRLKENIESEIPWKFPESIKGLDLTIMHYFIIEKALGIAGKHQRKDEHVSFERNFANCLEHVRNGDSQMALITNDIEMKQVIDVCHSGFTMPQKSTYFYPKAICGFLFASLQD